MMAIKCRRYKSQTGFFIFLIADQGQFILASGVDTKPHGGILDRGAVPETKTMPLKGEMDINVVLSI